MEPVQQGGNGLLPGLDGDGGAVVVHGDSLAGGQGHVIARAAAGHIHQLRGEVRDIPGALIQDDGCVIRTREDIEGGGLVRGDPADKERHSQSGQE